MTNNFFSSFEAFCFAPNQEAYSDPRLNNYIATLYHTTPHAPATRPNIPIMAVSILDTATNPATGVVWLYATSPHAPPNARPGFFVPRLSVHPATPHTAPPPEEQPITAIKTELITKYKVDPKRLEKGLLLAYDRGVVMIAQRDEHNNPIARPGWETLAIVRSETNPQAFYYVRPRHCTCPDAQRGNVCKHRIAVFVRRQIETYYTTQNTPSPYKITQPGETF